MRRAIGKHLKDFIAVIALFIVALGVGGYILSNQRLTLPGWVPFVGKNVFTLKGEFSTAQAVTPGQGQTVDIAGVKVGEISDVELKNGRAIVTMHIDTKYAAIYRDAHMLLRPKTGLKDMIVELSPGHPDTALPNNGKVGSGYTVPVSNTLPDVNLDEILAALDTDSRAYLQLLINGGGKALAGNGRTLSAALRRFYPTSRDLLGVTGMLATRRVNLERVIHNFQTLSTAVAGKDRQLSQLVDSSNTVFAALARQDASLRQSLQLLPGALQATNTGLVKTDAFARTLGPTLQALRPGARALGPSLKATRPFLRTTTPIIQNQLRPLARASLPVVTALRPAARNLNALTPDLTTVFGVANFALNELAYNPPGTADEGYLFWLSWANHDAAEVFSTQDAHGPIRRGLFMLSCATAGVLDQAAKLNPVLGTLVGLANAPRASDICPKGSGPGNLPPGP